MEAMRPAFYKQDDIPTYVVLYRISTNTKKQALSLPFQKDSIRTFIERYGGKILKEFEEKASAASYSREVLDKVVEMCRITGSILLVHKMSRLSRDGFVTISRLKRNNIQYIEAVSPNDSNFVKGIKLLQSEEENEERKANIKSGLAQIKRNIKKNGFHISKEGNRITSLGCPKNLNQDGRDKSIVTRRNKALGNKNNKKAIVVVDLLLKENLYLHEMATHLNNADFKTSTGKLFTPTAVSNLLKLFGKTRILASE